MATKLFVGKLPYATTDQELEAAFAAFGTVISARVAIDRDTKRSKGFGFVEMEDAEAAQNAINKLDGSELGGRQIVVNVSQPREDRPQSRDNFRGGFQRR
ncbi:MAG TPA: RNA-binding protein [Candidatus Saccharimonadales bacterium]|nr:RNA-binding protein [Candidatus Saccharimonadales bacterium]